MPAAAVISESNTTHQGFHLMGKDNNNAPSIMFRRLEGKVAIVTGGARGIGEATVKLFVKHGAKVVIADVEDAQGKALADSLPHSTTFVHCDVSNEDDVRNLVDTAVSQFGRLDILFNNAGVLGSQTKCNKSILNFDPTEFDRIMSVNVKGMALGIKHAARVMIPRGGGCVISTSSVAGFMGGMGPHAYTASKHAIVGLTKNTACELGRLAGINVTADNKLVVFGKEVLSNLDHNIFLTHHHSAGDSSSAGAFIGVASNSPGSRHVFPVGNLRGLRFMCVFRFKLWWMTQRMGNCGRDIPFETQFLMLEANNNSAPNAATTYVVFLPIIEHNFRAVLQGNAQDELQICLESGCPQVQNFDGTHLLYVAAGSDPFDVVSNAVKSVEKHLQTFCHRERKKMPDILNWFGWCTWDAFDTNVTSQGVKEGLQRY